MAGEVHVVEVQEHGVRVASREDGASRVGNGLVTRRVDGSHPPRRPGYSRYVDQWHIE